MDSIFLVGEGERAAFCQQMIQSYGYVYVCLWSYLPQPSSCLLALDGLYREQSDQPASSSGSLARRLFDTYRESVNYVDSGRAPGLAFKNNIPYMDLKMHDLQRLASNQVQLQFYQAARIKTVVFMGCATGEIELGVSNDPQVNLEVEMRNIFPMDFSRRQSISGSLPPHSDPNRPPSSSSSSLRSLSAESPEFSPLLFNSTINPTTTSFPQDQSAAFRDSLLAEALFRPVIPSSSSTSPRQALNQIRNTTHLPTIEREDAAMAKAILAVLSSPSSSSCTSHQNCTDNTAQNSASINPTAFRCYLPPSSHAAALRRPKNNMFKRAVSYFRNLNVVRRHEESHHHVQENRPSTTQLHHMISERRRREKLNESFQVLRLLLPPRTKKDKASVLSSTTEYLSSLKSQVEELGKRNQMLESRISVQKPTNVDQLTVASSSMERINVEITQVISASTSEARFLDLRVTVRGEGLSMLDVVIGLLEFLKQQRNVALLSIESNTRMLESVPVHGIMMRLKIEGDEFDKSGFQEAVRKVIDDRPGRKLTF